MNLLMIQNKENKGGHSLTVEKLSALLHGINLEQKGYFYCFNCFYCFRTENLNLKSNRNSNLMKKYVQLKSNVKL